MKSVIVGWVILIFAVVVGIPENVEQWDFENRKVPWPMVRDSPGSNHHVERGLIGLTANLVCAVDGGRESFNRGYSRKRCVGRCARKGLLCGMQRTLGLFESVILWSLLWSIHWARSRRLTNTLLVSGPIILFMAFWLERPQIDEGIKTMLIEKASEPRLWYEPINYVEHESAMNKSILKKLLHK